MMTDTKLGKRVETVETLQLPNPSTADMSVKFLKRLTGAAVSHITYARNLFNERDFCDKNFEGINIKVIKGLEKNSEGARLLTKWLAGAFDALTHKYLKCLVLEICEKIDDKDRLLESYSFHYTYQDGVKCTLEQDSQDSGKKTCEVLGSKLQDSVRNLIRNVLVMTSIQRQLPPNCVTSMKISYYDNTPEDYEPPHFKAFPGYPREFDGKTSKFNCGTVSTPFHSMCIKVRELDQQDKPTGPVKCLCGLCDAAPTSMLRCVVCKTFQHAACYQMLPEASQKDDHQCAKCSSMAISKDLEPTECTFRRLLTECSKSKSVSLGSLIRAVALSSEEMVHIMRRLQSEGALPTTLHQPFTTDTPNIPYKVNARKVEELVKKYFKL